MSVTLERYYLSSYTNNVYTLLAQPGASQTLVVRNLIITNTYSGVANVSVQVTESNGSTVRGTILGPYDIDAYGSLVFGPTDVMLVLKNQEQLQAKASVAGVTFAAFGGYE